MKKKPSFWLPKRVDEVYNFGLVVPLHLIGSIALRTYIRLPQSLVDFIYIPSSRPPPFFWSSQDYYVTISPPSPPAVRCGLLACLSLQSF
jgi:hypothetical protein